MKKNAYRDLTEQIQPPAGLNDRVLFAARRRAAEQEPAVPKHLAPRKRRPVFRAVVCAVCALVLVVGSVQLAPVGGGEGNADGAPVTALPAFSFGLTAYAADTGETYEANANGGVAFTTTEEMSWSESAGLYTGYLFQVQGEDIAGVSLAVDRGGLYRHEPLPDLTDEEIAEIREKLRTGEKTMFDYNVGGHYSIAENRTEWEVDQWTRLGAQATEDYNPAVSYGFWVPPERVTEAEKQLQDNQEQMRYMLDLFDGARLTVTVTFADGTEQTRTYTLSTGKLRVEYEEDGTPTLLPQLAGDEDPWIYGVYAVDEMASRFLQWPMEGATTISLSNPYGTPRWKPGGETYDAHTGIDIAAPEGQAVLAAAGGTVSEVGFDPERGNYLVLDHGDGLTTLYGQCRDFTVEEGDTVRAGEQIGAVGSTGMSTGPHLHFEVRQDGEPQNPVAYFDSDVRDTLTMG